MDVEGWLGFGWLFGLCLIIVIISIIIIIIYIIIRMIWFEFNLLKCDVVAR